jgi:very-long-chain enoyl-CoA reductase
MWMLLLHFAKRELETVFVHKFSAATMPAAYILRNSAHYWILAGLNISYFVFAPGSLASLPLAALSDVQRYAVYAGLALYVYGELANLYTHVVLSNLRPRGTTIRAIPKGFGFNWVTCPNYLFEIVAWIGIALVARSWATVVFIAVAWWMMQRWAVVREKRYRKEFAGVYRPHRYPLTPGLALPVRKENK